MSSSAREDVAIVIGAGPAGLAAALSLSNVCNRVFLVEKHETFEKRGATFGMAINGQKTLDELSPGLYEDMKEAGITGIPGGSWMLIWWEMRDTILRHVQRRPNVEINCGEEFTDIQQSDEGICVRFKSGLELRGDFLVGADGVHSDVRNVLDLPPLLVSNTTNYRGSIQVSDSASSDLKELLEKGIAPLVVPGGGNVYFILFNFHTRHPGRMAWILATQIDVRSDPNLSIFDLVNEHVGDDKKQQLINEILHLSDKETLLPYKRSSFVDLSDEVLSSFGGGWGGRGRITLVGDAAHGMRPTDGYGGSMALEDAVVLARCLKQEESLPERLRRFESERLPRVKKVYDNQCQRYDARMKGGKRLVPQSPEFLEWLFAGV